MKYIILLIQFLQAIIGSAWMIYIDEIRYLYRNSITSSNKFYFRFGWARNFKTYWTALMFPILIMLFIWFQGKVDERKEYERTLSTKTSNVNTDKRFNELCSLVIDLKLSMKKEFDSVASKIETDQRERPPQNE